MRTKVAVAVAASAVMMVSAAGSAQALACSRWPFRGFDGATYYYYGVDSISGNIATATTGVGGNPCLFYARSVSTTIRLPNGSHAAQSSTLGGCQSAVSIYSGSYNAFQISSSHTLTLWNGATWTYVD